MASELHALTYKLSVWGDALKRGSSLGEQDLDELAEQIASIAHRAQAVAELERKRREPRRV